MLTPLRLLKNYRQTTSIYMYIHTCHYHSSTDLVLLYVTSYVVLCNGLPVTCVLYGQFNLFMLPHCQCLYLSSPKNVLRIIVANCLMMYIEPLLCLQCSLKKLTSQRWVLHIVSIMEIVGRRVDMRRKKGQIRLR